MKEKIDAVLGKIVAFSNARYVKIIMNGFMGVAALTIAGSLFQLLASIPIPAYQTFLTSSGLGEILKLPIAATSELMGIYIVISMGNQLAKSFDKDGFTAGLISLGAFMILTPMSATGRVMDAATGQMTAVTLPGAISTSVVGAQGIFLAIITALIASRLYVFLDSKGIKIKMPGSVPPIVSSMFENMIPGGLVFLVFLVIRFVVGKTPFGTAQNLIYSVLQQPLMKVGGGFGGVVAVTLLIKVFWLFGVHGGMIVNSVIYPIHTAAVAANLAAFAAGEAAPNPEWAIVMLMNNIGMLGLNIVMFTAKSQQYKSLAKITLPTSVFNISEPLMFGFPLILNPIMAVPFVLTSFVDFLVSIGLMRAGIVAMATGAQVNAFLPTPIALAFANSHWSGFLLGVFLIVIDAMMFYPFFKVADKRALNQEKEEEKENAITA